MANGEPVNDASAEPPLTTPPKPPPKKKKLTSVAGEGPDLMDGHDDSFDANPLVEDEPEEEL